LEIETQEIPDPVAEKLINGINGKPQPQPRSPQLNQRTPGSTLDDLHQINAQNLVSAQELERSALTAEIQRMGAMGAHVGSLAVTAYQQNLLRQIASGLGEWSQVAKMRSQQLQEIRLSDFLQTNQTEAQSLIAENSKIDSPQLLTVFAPGTFLD